MKIILVGQAPNKGADAKEPLSGPSGRRLAALAGLDHAAFLERFQRINLLESTSAPDVQAMRNKADELRLRWKGRRVVLLGRHVALAFRLVADDYDWFKPVQVEPGVEIAVMPHPSGISAWWNDKQNVESARQFMQRLNIGFFTLKRSQEKLPTGRPEIYRPEQVAAAIIASDGIVLRAAEILADETGIACDRTTVLKYIERYPVLAEIRERCRHGIVDVAEKNVAQAVRAGDVETSRWLLRSDIAAGRGYGLQVNAKINGKIQHDHRHAHLHAKINGSLDLGRYSAEQLAAIEDFMDVLGVSDTVPNPEGDQS